MRNYKEALLIEDFKNLTNVRDLISYELYYEKSLHNEPRIVKLICGHCFFYDYIFRSYKITNKIGSNYIGKRICPYCTQYGGYLPLIKGHYIKGIHIKRSQTNNKDTIANRHNCSAIIKTGKQAGEKCGCSAK